MNFFKIVFQFSRKKNGNIQNEKFSMAEERAYITGACIFKSILSYSIGNKSDAYRGKS